MIEMRVLAIWCTPIVETVATSARRRAAVRGAGELNKFGGRDARVALRRRRQRFSHERSRERQHRRSLGRCLSTSPSSPSSPVTLGSDPRPPPPPSPLRPRPRQPRYDPLFRCVTATAPLEIPTLGEFSSICAPPPPPLYSFSLWNVEQRERCVCFSIDFPERTRHLQ